ncbi:MAG: hypothetical protein ACREFE_17900 [Limisphaerales bacterium]
MLLGFFSQGCVVWRYTDTPPVSGVVVDASTRQPIAGAKVGFRKHKHVDSFTASDGSFHIRPTYIWRPCFILPGEFWRSSGLFFVQTSGYKPFEQEVNTSMGAAYMMPRPVLLQRDSQ